MNKDNYVTRQKNRKTGKVPKFGRRGLGFGKRMKLERESLFFSFLPSRAHISQIFNFQSLNKKVY